MTGLVQTRQHSRVLQSAFRDAQAAWNSECHSDALPEMQLVTRRCIPVDSDKIATMTLAEWDAEMRAKYGEEEL